MDPSTTTTAAHNLTAARPQSSAVPATVRAAQIMMWVAALAAAVAAVAALVALPDASSDTTVVRTWRAYGLVVFAGLFAVLALRPHGYRGVWELVIFHKVALTLTASGYAAHGGIAGTSTILASDGTLSVLLVVAYVLCRGWRSHPHER